VTVAVLAAMTFLKRISVILRKMERIVGISEAADEPGVSISTCAARGWGLGAGGKLVVEHPAVGQKAEELSPIAVCRQHDEAVNLERQGGLLTDRDWNVAKNLKRLAASSAVSACGEKRSGAVRKRPRKTGPGRIGNQRHGRALRRLSSALRRFRRAEKLR